MTRYCGVKQARRFARVINYTDLGFTTEDEYEDHIEELVDAASRYLDDYCKRPDDFFNGGATITEHHNGPAYLSADYPTTPYSTMDRNREKRRTFYLRHYPVLSISYVKENTALIGESDSWEARTEYRYDTGTGILKFSHGSIPKEGFNNVQFIYVAGYSTTPRVIQWVCAELVGNWLKDALSKRSTQYVNRGHPSEMEFETPTVFTDEMKERLRKYVKRR